MTRRALSHICKLLTLLAAGTATVSAQGDPSLVSDQVLGGTGGQIERVELSNGGVNLSIPLVRVKGRGKDFTFRLNYSSKSLYPAALTGSSNWVTRFPWRFSTPTTFKNPAGSWSPMFQCTNGPATYTVGVTANYIFSLPDGSQELTPNLIWDTTGLFCNPPAQQWPSYFVAYS